MGTICAVCKKSTYVYEDNQTNNNVPLKRQESGADDKRLIKRNTGNFWNRKNSLARANTLYIEAGDAEIDPEFEKSAEDRNIIMNALNNHFIFTSLTDEDKE